MYSNIIGKTSAVVVAVAMTLAAFAFIAPLRAEAACNFTRDLSVGVTGEDVRCLQVYLNTTGNARIAAAGPGSPGNETTIYGSLTGAAVARWQTANGISPANGNFGPASRAKYTAVAGGSTGTPTVPGASTDQVRAKIALLEAIAAYKDAVDEDGDSDLVEDAATSLLNAMVYYVNGNYTQAIAAANTATNDAEDSIGGSNDDDDDDNDDNDNDTNKYDAEDTIDEAEQAVEDADDDVAAAADDEDADEDDIEEAEDLIAEAEDLIDEAWVEFDDENYDEAVDLAEEAEDLADEAVDVANGNSSSDDDEEEDAEDALNDAQDDLDAAWDDVNEANDDGEDTDDAEDLLNDAEDLLNDAEDAFDDEDYDEVMDLVDEAQELIEEALDEI